ncbi:MAG: BON domain-containing protein [Planctomycetales bacterium]|nr:BON domain-containing protein [Planctomycetales bacterium]
MEATLTANPLQEQVQCALNRSPYISQKRIQFKTFAGRVRLEGTVGSFYQKQMAQELVRRVDGVELVENQLQVSWR